MLFNFTGIPGHTAVRAVLTLRAQAGSAGQTLVNAGAVVTPVVQDFVPITANRTQTYVLRGNETLRQMGSQIVDNALAVYGGSVADAAALAGNLTFESTATTVVNAAAVSFQNSAVVVPLGYLNNVAQIVATSGGNLIAQGGGNIVATGGGNIVATGGGNLISVSGRNGADILAGLISEDGGGVVGSSVANILSGGGNNLIAQDGGGLIGNDGGGLIATPTGNLIAQGGGNIVASGGGNIVAQGAGNLVAQGAGNTEPGGRIARDARRIRRPRALAAGQPAHGSPTNSVTVHVTNTRLVIVGGGGVGN